jgi:ABC-2 type transport system permease protein
VVAHVLRLRLDLLLGALRAGRRQTVRTLVGGAVIAVVVVAVCIAAWRLHASSEDAAFAVTIVAASALTLGFFVTVLVGGVDDQLDPRRFAVVGASPREIAGVTLLASAISVPALALIVVAVALSALWTDRGAPVWVSIVSAVLGVLTCLLLAKIGLALASMVRDRRSRELTGVFLIALIVVVVPVVVFLASLQWTQGVPSALVAAVDLLALTPLGAAWALPERALSGGAAAPAVIAVLSVAALAALWFWLVDRLMTTTERPGAARQRRGLGWFDLTGGTAAGGIAARSIIYWFRDPRYLVNMIIVPIASALTIIPLLLVGVPFEFAVLLPAPLIALFLGWLPHNDLAYDSTALWMHIAGAVRGAADRAGRLVPIAVVGVVLLAVAVPVTISLHGRWAMLPAMAGVCASLFLGGLGLSSLTSVIAPYAVSRPGDSPFQQPQRTGGGLSQAVVMFGAVLLSVPALWWAWLALTVDESWAWTALWGGAGIGAAALLIGIFAGGAVFDRTGERLMEFAEST